MKKRSWSEWFIYDLKKLKAQARRIGRNKSYLALSAQQRSNLADTQQEMIDELERIKEMVKK